MTSKAFRPMSRQEAERSITREQRDFSAGMFDDLASASIPNNGVAYLKNFINKGTELVGRSGSRKWGDYIGGIPHAPLPTIVDGLSATSTVGGNIRTVVVSGISFYEETIGDFFVFDNGVHEKIINVVSGTGILYTQTTSSEEYIAINASLRKQTNGLYFHRFLKKIVLHLGEDFYISDAYIGEWKKCICESYLKPANEISTIDEKDTYVLISNTNGIFKLDLNTNVNDNYFYYRINSLIPFKATQETQSDVNPYIRRYIYGLSKIDGDIQNRTRQTDGSKLVLESGTNKLGDDGIDYVEIRSSFPVDDSSTTILKRLELPRYSTSTSHRDNHWDCFSIYGTLDLGVNALSATNSERYIWIEDIPIMKALLINVNNTDCTVLQGAIKNHDVGCMVRICNGSVIEMSMVATVNEELNTFTLTNPLSVTSISNTTISIGALRLAGFTFNTVDNTLTTSTGFLFNSNNDIGKRIFLSNGKIVHITDVISGRARIAESFTDGEVFGGCWDPEYRNFMDTTSDDVLRARISAYPCYQRFYEPLPASSMVSITGGFLFSAKRNENYIYYSAMPDGFEYLCGYYHPVYQLVVIKDGIRAIKELSDRLMIYCYGSTHYLSTNTYSEVNIEELGISIPVVSQQVVIDENIGVTAYGSIQSLENGNHIMITNEPAIRVFNGSRYGENLASGKLMNILKTLQPNISSIYSSLTGYVFWGLDE